MTVPCSISGTPNDPPYTAPLGAYPPTAEYYDPVLRQMTVRAPLLIFLSLIPFPAHDSLAPMERSATCTTTPANPTSTFTSTQTSAPSPSPSCLRTTTPLVWPPCKSSQMVPPIYTKKQTCCADPVVSPPCRNLLLPDPHQPQRDPDHHRHLAKGR